MDWQLVASYFTVKSTDIFYNARDARLRTVLHHTVGYKVIQSYFRVNTDYVCTRYPVNALTVIKLTKKSISAQDG